MARTIIKLMLGGLGLLAAARIGWWMVRFYVGRRRADRVWDADQYPKLQDMGAVQRLVIVPLIDRHTARDELAGEPGVSYLIRADDTNILFDVGYNQKGEHPSPLLRNMRTLGVTPAEIHQIVISHLHLDHVGGLNRQRARSFALSGEWLDLGGVTAFVPERMTHPTAQVEVVQEPRVIAPGVASMGPIPRQLFFLGWTPEQSLAINVEGKGLVLMSGCGHATIQRILARAEMLFEEPIYGVVGGLHYPVTGSRRQRILGSDKWPWSPINCDDVEASIKHLARRAPQLIALSPHDSCDWSRDALRLAFGEAYQDIQVGTQIEVSRDSE
jgi:7,8-dihydropterin-6-yl-methyl-4-(beta-D-ribofuranosyl)aminobenzene 5'-phosphate synthase